MLTRSSLPPPPDDKETGEVSSPPQAGEEEVQRSVSIEEPREDASPQVLRTLLTNQRRLLSFLQRRVGDAELAAEILQDAFLKAIERGHTLREEESSLAWCYRLLRNAIIDRHRRSHAEQGALDRLAREAGATVDLALAQEVCACMTELVVTLKPEYADILRRVDLAEARIDHVAEELGITPNNASVRLHRARQALRQRLEQLCGACAHHGCLNCTCSRPAQRSL